MKVNQEKFVEIWKKKYPNEEICVPEALYNDIVNCGLIVLIEDELREMREEHTDGGHIECCCTLMIKEILGE